jgi:hypothetical protein
LINHYVLYFSKVGTFSERKQKRRKQGREVRNQRVMWKEGEYLLCNFCLQFIVHLIDCHHIVKYHAAAILKQNLNVRKKKQRRNERGKRTGRRKGEL